MIKMSIYFALLFTVSADIANKGIYVAGSAESTVNSEAETTPKFGTYRLKAYPKSGNCYVILSNGDRLRGTFLKFEKSKLFLSTENTSFRSHLGDFRVPTGRIKSVNFRDLKKTKKKSDLLILSDNLYLSGKYLSDEGLFRSFILGDLLINNDNISIVDWRK